MTLKTSRSLFDRFILRLRPPWITFGISLVLILAPFAALSLDGLWNSSVDFWRIRPILVSPVVVVYILLVSQLMAKNDENMLQAFRPLVLIDDDSFDQMVRDASRINPVGEVIAMLVGVLIGLGLSVGWLESLNTPWLRFYVPSSLCLMHGLLAWLIYTSVAGTKLNTQLHRQPLQVDILDARPFEPVGRSSLITTLVFIGGVTLGALFGLDINSIFTWQTLLVYVPFLIVPVLIFFLSMRETHRVLAIEKKRQLQVVSQKIHQSSQAMKSKLEKNEILGETAVEYTALVTYEARLKTAPTWPYNTGMLRTLFVTLLLPLLVRALSVLFFEK